MVNSFLTPKLREGESVDLSLFSPRERTNIRLYGLECKDWTPADVADFKRSWAPKSNPIIINNRRYKEAKHWCRENCYHQDFTIIQKLLPDDTQVAAVHFRREEDAMIFKLAFSG